MASAGDPKPPTCEAWKLLFELFMSYRDHVPAVAAELELSEMQCHVLRLLSPGEASPMARIAEALSCDASNVTGIADRLEARGFVSRRQASRDRRVRMIQLTPAGTAVRQKVVERLSRPPSAIARLSAEDQRTLCDILERALGRPRSGD